MSRMQTGLGKGNNGAPEGLSPKKFVFASVNFRNVSVSRKFLNWLYRRFRSVGFLQNSPLCSLKPENSTQH